MAKKIEHCSMCEKMFEDVEKIFDFKIFGRVLRLHEACYNNRAKLSPPDTGRKLVEDEEEPL